MFSSGGALVKFLATVAAFMTVTSGTPRTECVCPDGRVKYHCTGHSLSGCCCDSSSTPSATGVRRGRSEAGGVTPTCCGRARQAAPARPAGDGEAPVAKNCGCQRTVVADAVAYTAKDAGDAEPAETVSFVSRECLSAAPEPAARTAWVERRFLLPPPDRVVLFCHFTC